MILKIESKDPIKSLKLEILNTFFLSDRQKLMQILNDKDFVTPKILKLIDGQDVETNQHIIRPSGAALTIR